MAKIYFKNGDKAKTIEELLRIGFKGNYFCETYEDKKLTIEQCLVARRSFSDLLIIAKTYFPSITEKEVAEALVNDYTSYFCTDIKKVVFLNLYNQKGFARGYAPPDREGVDGWSFNKIQDLIK